MEVHGIDVFYVDHEAPSVTFNCAAASAYGRPLVTFKIDGLTLYTDDPEVLERISRTALAASRDLAVARRRAAS